MTLAQQAVVVLRDAGVMLDPGLGEGDIGDVEARYGIRFGDDHRALLALAVPIGPNWVDWRRDDDADIRRRLAWPHDSAVWHVQHTLKDWPRSWGQRPEGDDDFETVARRHLARWHPLIPVWGHRYLPGAPAPAGSHARRVPDGARSTPTTPGLDSPTTSNPPTSDPRISWTRETPATCATTHPGLIG